MRNDADFRLAADLVCTIREVRCAFDRSKLPAMRWFSFSAELRSALERGAPLESLIRRARDFEAEIGIEARREKVIAAPSKHYRDRW